jgi:hypothetical protein
LLLLPLSTYLSIIHILPCLLIIKTESIRLNALTKLAKRREEITNIVQEQNTQIPNHPIAVPNPVGKPIAVPNPVGKHIKSVKHQVQKSKGPTQAKRSSTQTSQQHVSTACKTVTSVSVQGAVPKVVNRSTQDRDQQQVIQNSHQKQDAIEGFEKVLKKSNILKQAKKKRRLTKDENMPDNDDSSIDSQECSDNEFTEQPKNGIKKRKRSYADVSDEQSDDDMEESKKEARDEKNDDETIDENNLVADFDDSGKHDVVDNQMRDE